MGPESSYGAPWGAPHGTRELVWGPNRYEPFFNDISLKFMESFAFAMQSTLIFIRSNLPDINLDSAYIKGT